MPFFLKYPAHFSYIEFLQLVLWKWTKQEQYFLLLSEKTRFAQYNMRDIVINRNNRNIEKLIIHLSNLETISQRILDRTYR